jgi:hypothetical protein
MHEIGRVFGLFKEVSNFSFINKYEYSNLTRIKFN